MSTRDRPATPVRPGSVSPSAPPEAGAASADATMTAIGRRGQVTVIAKGDDAALHCDFSVLDPSRATISSKEVTLAPKATQTVKLTSIPSGEPLHSRHGLHRPEHDIG
ncbi:hypothetical protein H5400_04955 [Rhodococcus wratislaviensis]|nr:hypothetical protein [Rhodococcus sp. 3A]